MCASMCVCSVRLILCLSGLSVNSIGCFSRPLCWEHARASCGVWHIVAVRHRGKAYAFTICGSTVDGKEGCQLVILLLCSVSLAHLYVLCLCLWGAHIQAGCLVRVRCAPCLLCQAGLSECSAILPLLIPFALASCVFTCVFCICVVAPPFTPTHASILHSY